MRALPQEDKTGTLFTAKNAEGAKGTLCGVPFRFAWGVTDGLG
jgi:hypothetical protein